MNPCFAIIDRNTLSSLSLKAMLCDIFDQVEVYAYGSMRDFIIDSNRHFVHFFVSSDILFTDADEFETLKNRTTVISNGKNRPCEDSGFKVLDVSLQEHDILQELMYLLPTGLYAETPTRLIDTKGVTDKLSAREKEVLTLMIKGLINKEIADKLAISLPTVIFHRNNICLKLKTRSIGKMTVYAVLAGLIDINEI